MWAYDNCGRAQKHMTWPKAILVTMQFTQSPSCRRQSISTSLGAVKSATVLACVLVKRWEVGAVTDWSQRRAGGAPVYGHTLQTILTTSSPTSPNSPIQTLESVLRPLSSVTHSQPAHLSELSADPQHPVSPLTLHRNKCRNQLVATQSCPSCWSSLPQTKTPFCSRVQTFPGNGSWNTSEWLGLLPIPK